MSDEDATTKLINGWKKLNTLAHYGVKESAVMSLVPRKMTNCTLTNGHCKSSYRNCKQFNSDSITFKTFLKKKVPGGRVVSAANSHAGAPSTIPAQVKTFSGGFKSFEQHFDCRFELD